MTKDLKNVESDFYKWNEETNEFEYVKHLTSNITDGKILMEVTDNGTVTQEEYNIDDLYDSTYNSDTGEGSIGVNAGGWQVGSREGTTEFRNDTISVIIQALGSAIGGALGAIIGIPVTGGVVGGALGNLASRIYDRKVKSVRYRVDITYRYSYPYYEYNTNAYFWDLDTNSYIGGATDSGKVAIHM